MSASRHRRWGIARLRPVLPAVLTVAVVAIDALLAPPRAPAAPLKRCTPSRGTIVAVDFAHWGGPIVRGCGVGSRSGYALLHAAGFTTAGDEHDGPAVVCRLGDAAFHHGRQYPTPNEQACVQTPPTTAYWAYWIAPRGTNHWAYAPLGAMGDVPKPGEVELWIFGATNVSGTHGTAVPSFSPAALRARAPAPTRSATTRTTQRATSTTTTPTTSTSTTTSTTRTSATTTTRASAAAPTATARTRTSPPPAAPRHRTRRHPARHRAAHPVRRHAATTAHRTSTTATNRSPNRAGGARVVSARPTSRRASAGSSTPLIIGGALVAVLCAGAARAIWLRRREE